MDWRIMLTLSQLQLRDDFTQSGRDLMRGRGNKLVMWRLFMQENEITGIVVDLCVKIHKKDGPGLFESVYEEIFCYELLKTKIAFDKQRPVPLIHEEIKLDAGFRADLIIEKKSL